MSAKDKTPEAPKTVLSDKVIALATLLEERLQVDKKAGVLTEKAGEVDLFSSTLPAEYTIEDVNTLDDHKTTFVAASTYVGGKLAVEAMKGNKDLKVVTGEIAMGKHTSVSLNIERSHTYSNHLAGEGEKTVKYGVVTVSLDTKAGHNSGQLKAARKLVGELGLAAKL